MPVTNLSRVKSFIEFFRESCSMADLVRPEFFSVDAEFCLIVSFLSIKVLFLGGDDYLIVYF